MKRLNHGRQSFFCENVGFVIFCFTTVLAGIAHLTRDLLTKLTMLLEDVLVELHDFPRRIDENN